MSRAVFHLSLPVRDIEQTRAFYCGVLGAVPGRATPEWIDLIVFGHQVTFHQRPAQVLPPEAQGVQHFGAILDWADWEALCARTTVSGYPLPVPPAIIRQGSLEEHGKLVLRDPSGHLLEFKAYRHPATVLPEAGADPSPEPRRSGQPRPRP